MIMPCLQAITIINPKSNPTLRDRHFLSVPCGHCSECRKQKRNSWFVRAYYQYLETTEVYKGDAFYFTLTYDPKHLPTYMVNGEDIPCFSKDDIQKFLKRFRRHLSYDAKNNVDVKYLITSELGDLRQRPHYHGIIFVNTPLGYFQQQHVKFLIYKSWGKGIVNFGSKASAKKFRNLGILESPQALHYVCKYICKDIDFNYDILPKRNKHSLEYLHSDDINYDVLRDDSDIPYLESLNIAKQNREQFDVTHLMPRECAPFHLQSKGFGSYMIKRLGLSQEYPQAFQYMVAGVFFLPGYDKPYAIPQYVQRKVLFDYIYRRNPDKTVDVEYILNHFGKDVRKQQELLSVEHAESEFRRVLLSAHSFFQTDWDERLNLFNARCGTDFKSPLSITDWLENQDIDFQNLAIYSRVFMNRIYLPVSDWDVFGDETDGQSYTINTARTYLDFLYSDYCDEIKEIYDNANNRTLELSTIPRTDRKITEDYLAGSFFAQTFPDLYPLYIEIYNTLCYFGGIDADRKYFEEEKLYRNKKLLQKEVI